VALLAVVAAGCVPQPAPTLPACPQRVEVKLEPADLVNFSLPRAVSSNGEWLVTSRVVGTDMVFALRRTAAGAASATVGSLPYSLVAGSTLLVSVASDGSQVVFGVAGTAATETSPQTTLSRWRAATGTVDDLPVPVVPAPPPGVPYPVNARAVSADGRKVLWTQSFRDGPEPYVWNRVVLVTDVASGAVSAAPLGDHGIGWLTADGSAFLDGDSLVETATGDVTDLAPEVAAAQAAFPGPQLHVSAVSDDQRYLAMQRYDASVAPGVLTVIVWDRTTDSGRVAVQVSTTGNVGDPGIQLDALGAGGTLLYAQRMLTPPPAGPATVLESHPAAGTLTVASSATPLTPTFDWAVSTTDGRTVVVSRQGVLGQELVAERCA
jgi:hypothetical protein